MGKFKKKQYKKNRDRNEQDKRYDQLEALENPIYERFYKEALKPYFEQDQQDEEWKIFWESMKEPLSTTFRVNSIKSNFNDYTSKLVEGNGRKYILDLYEKQKQEFEQNEKDFDKRTFKDEEEKQRVYNDLIQRKQTLKELVEDKLLRFEQVPWIENTFQINGQKLNKIFKKLNQEITLANDIGLLTRQELVSMIPPLMLNPEPEDTVIDLCAAPGSKTSQLLEMMHTKASRKNEEVQGFVMSNELVEDRCHILSHRLNRNGGSQATVTVNHLAQFIPEYKNKDNSYFRFDKVLADVPCTGDGIARKSKDMWISWSSKNAFVLYPVQLSILIRALQLVKVGGYVVYSTCSISPIEDEAIIQEAFKKAIPGSLELVDCHSRIPKFKGRKGMNKWKMILSKLNKKDFTLDELKQKQFDEMFEEIKDFSEVQGKIEKKTTMNEQYKLLKQSMWAESQEFLDTINIQNTMRCLSHDNDTGGFYIALLRKRQDNVFQEDIIQNENFDSKDFIEEYKKNIQIPIGEMKQYKGKDIPLQNDEKIIKMFDSNMKPEETLRTIQQKDYEILEPGNKIVLNIKGSKKHSQVYEIHEYLSEQEYDQIQKQFNVPNIQPKQLVTSVRGITKKVRLFSQKLSEFMEVESNQKQLHCMNAGVKVFQKEGNDFRIQKDGIQRILPYIGNNRIETSLKSLLTFVGKVKVEIESIEDQELKEKILKLGNQQTFVLYTQLEGSSNNVECIAAYTFGNCVLPILTKEQTQAFQLLYNYDQLQF